MTDRNNPQQLHNGCAVTRNGAIPIPAYAYAYACTRKEPVPRLEQWLGRADWDHLREERVAIMVESGICENRALALATHDITVNHGIRPACEV